MLSRNALGLYWIGRYLERAQHGCRLIADQFETMNDRPVDEIDRSWRRLFQGLQRTPAGGALDSNLDDEHFMLVDAFTLSDDLTFEPANPDAIVNCLAAARENARQVRNAIDADLWSSLNRTFLDRRDLGIADIWKDRPHEFYRRTGDALRTFFGIADGVLYRDDGWHFLQLGRFVERAQLLAGLIDAHLAVYPADGPQSDPDWLSLLRICEAQDAYGRLHSLRLEPTSVVDFLVADPRLSHSVRHALAQICAALDAISAGRPLLVEAGRRAGRLAARIDYDWPNRDPGDDGATRAALQEILGSCRRLHHDIDAAYFSYPAGDAPETGPDSAATG